MRKKYFLILLVAILVHINAVALTLELNDFKQDVKPSELVRVLKKHSLDEKDLSIVLTKETNGESSVVLSVSPQKPLIPASVTKLITAATILDQLPQDVKFKTQILIDKKKVKGNSLKGDLYFKGGGDPSFVSENLWYIINIFTRSGVKKIEGDIVVDDTLFDNIRFDSSRESIRVDRAYDAPVGALSFNWNAVNIFVRPALELGSDKAVVFLDPLNDFTELENKALTSGKNTSLIVDRRGDKQKNKITISGLINKTAQEQTVFKNITEPDLWAGENLKSFLLQRGITITGQVRRGATDNSASVVAEYESKNISQILADMNKFSNNYVAEMLTKQLGLLLAKPGSLANGTKVINNYMKSLKLPQDQYILNNPSGLTRDNRLSSYVLWKVLISMKNDFRHYPEFAMSLPIAGFDGTLKRRLKGTSAEGLVRAKTGYLNKVVSLAGYAGRKDGAMLTFSMIYNGPVDEAKVRNCFDELLIEVIK